MYGLKRASEQRKQMRAFVSRFSEPGMNEAKELLIERAERERLREAAAPREVNYRDEGDNAVRKVLSYAESLGRMIKPVRSSVIQNRFVEGLGTRKDTWKRSEKEGG